MKGHRTPSMNGIEYDVVYRRRYYGHKPGGETVYSKRAMNRRERRADEADTILRLLEASATSHNEEQ